MIIADNINCPYCSKQIAFECKPSISTRRTIIDCTECKQPFVFQYRCDLVMSVLKVESYGQEHN